MSITLNPDKDFVEEMRKLIAANDGHCPCAIIKNEDSLCMCKDFREQESGECHCGLYIKSED